MILSARYASPDKSCAFVVTSDNAGVIYSENDTPDKWDELLSSGVTIEDYIAPVISEYPKDVIIISPNGTHFKVIVDNEGNAATEIVV